MLNQQMTKPGSLIQREFTMINNFCWAYFFFAPPAIHYPTLYKHFLLFNAAMAAPNVHNTYIYHPFSTLLNGQIHTKMTTSTLQILTLLTLPVLDITRVNMYNPNKQCSQQYTLEVIGMYFMLVSRLA